MGQYNYNHILGFLNQSFRFIQYYHNKYNRYLSKRKDCKSLNIKLDYHLFCFTQILYSLKERLKHEIPNKESDINNFFEVGADKPKSIVGKVYNLANMWKHKEGPYLRKNFSGLKIYKITKERLPPDIISQNILVDVDSEQEHYVHHLTISKVDKRLSVLNELNIGDKPLNSIFEEALHEIKNFVNKIKT